MNSGLHQSPSLRRTAGDAEAIVEFCRVIPPADLSADAPLHRRLPLVRRQGDAEGMRGDGCRANTGIVSFLAPQGEEVRQLYTRPDRIGGGAGTQLIEAAKSSGAAALELWCFQANTRARRFYEARGFHAIRFTDGADNEERTPDVRYRWERASN
jgi:GNAT superfamily N-acetyltransferase